MNNLSKKYFTPFGKIPQEYIQMPACNSDAGTAVFTGPANKANNAAVRIWPAQPPVAAHIEFYSQED